MNTTPRAACGFTLVEMMIAMALGLFVVAVVTTLFVNNSRTLRGIDQTIRQMENGRFAMQLIGEDVRLAGYFAEFDPSVLGTPSAKPDPCSDYLADLTDALPVHIQGYDGSDGGLSCLSEVKRDTDVLVVRRVKTCVSSVGDCAAADNDDVMFQASLCNAVSELGSASFADRFALDSNRSNLDKHKRDCSSGADLRELEVHVYFVAENSVEAGDGIPTLKRWELGSGIVPLVEGIENLQVEYGIDDNDDGGPDTFTADPNLHNGCTGADCVKNWRNVTAVRIHLLSRSVAPSPGYRDTKTYLLGLHADGSENSVGNSQDAYRRSVYSSLYVVKNVAGRREK